MSAGTSKSATGTSRSARNWRSSRTRKTRPAPWTQSVVLRRGKRLGPNNAQREARAQAYSVEKRDFLAVNRKCERCRFRDSEDVHHVRGRSGALLLDKRWWEPLCRRCHRWIHDHPADARMQGWLAERGEWGKATA